MDKVEEIKKDIAELESLQKQATRQKNKDIISIQIRKLISDVVNLEEKLKVQNTDAPKTTPSSVSNGKYEIKINNYAWDQSDKFIKFYITLKNVQTAPAENISCQFEPKNIYLSIKNVDNKDYSWQIKNLLKEIDPEKSSWKVKSDRSRKQKNIDIDNVESESVDAQGNKYDLNLNSEISNEKQFPSNKSNTSNIIGSNQSDVDTSKYYQETITNLVNNENSSSEDSDLEARLERRVLKKVYITSSGRISKPPPDTILINANKKISQSWSHVTEWEKKASDSKTPKIDPDKTDPSDSLMSLMKSIYESGDDETKRSVAKAWTESQQMKQSSFLG